MRRTAKPLIFIAGLAFSASMAQAITVAEVVKTFQDAAYSGIEVKEGPNQIKVEGIKDGMRVEVVYDKASGSVIKRESQAVGLGETNSNLEVSNTDDDSASDDSASDDSAGGDNADGDNAADNSADGDNADDNSAGDGVSDDGPDQDVGDDNGDSGDSGQDEGGQDEGGQDGGSDD